MPFFFFFFLSSVYDLVKGNHFLDLTDPKLLGWYQSLPAVDRMLLQGMINILLAFNYSKI